MIADAKWKCHTCNAILKTKPHIYIRILNVKKKIFVSDMTPSNIFILKILLWTNAYHEVFAANRSASKCIGKRDYYKKENL